MPDPAAPPSPLEQAQTRLEAALSRLEATLRAGARPAADGGAEASRLRDALNEAGERERRLEEAAAEASAALGRAASEVRAALQAEV